MFALLLTPKQVAAKLSVSPRTVYLWIEEGRLPSVRLSERVTRVPAEAVDASIAAATRPAVKSLPALASEEDLIAAETSATYTAAPASEMSTSERLWLLLQAHRDEIIEIVERNKGTNVRVFGSVIHGDATEESDIDLIIDSCKGMSLFDLGEINFCLSELLGVSVDVGIAGSLREQIRDRITAEAVRL